MFNANVLYKESFRDVRIKLAFWKNLAFDALFKGERAEVFLFQQA